MSEMSVQRRSAAASLAAGIEPLRAMRVLDGQVVRTEIRRLRWLERWTGVPVWAKLECHQITGSFKYRGAFYRLNRQDRLQGVIAASAGNHGLAVAEVARLMGIPANICVPANSSPLKREHILATGQGLIASGNSLEEATQHARALAERCGWAFISPYNDPDIIAGQSTIAVELLRDVPEIETLVAPVGGGGLICGLALGAHAVGHDPRVFGVEPERYPSLSASLEDQAVRRVSNQPTIADGLAVNLDAKSITVDLAEELLDGIVLITEEELAAATLAVLFHESLLVEPAGAAAILGAIRLARQGLLYGPVGLPLCGGNLHHTTLARLQRWSFTDLTCQELLDLRGRPVPHQAAPKVINAYGIAPAVRDKTSAFDFVRTQLEHCLKQADSFATKLADFIAYSGKHDLLVSQDAVDMVCGMAASSRALAQSALVRLTHAYDGMDDDILALCEADMRAAMQGLAAARNGLEWRSAAYGQSRIAQFFDVGFQDSPGVNYDRYEHAEAKRIELQLVEALSLPADRLAVTVTSSGMAAYALLEAHLLRDRLIPGTCVVTSPYIYFEADEQIQSLPGVTLHRAAGYDVDSLVAAIESCRPAGVFVDPLANNVDQRMIDINGLVETIKARDLGPLVVVIDGSMIPGVCADVLRLCGRGVDVYYYESCSKYLQFGLDMTMAGAVVHPAAEKPRFDRLRRNLGLMLYPGSAQTFPSYDRDLLRERVARIGRNAEFIARRLAADPAVARLARVVHPLLPSHPDQLLAEGLGCGGGCVTFDFLHKGDSHRDQLESLIETVLGAAAATRVQLAKGVSFGFTQPRISAAASMSESEPPFLRLYAGDLSHPQCEGLCEVIAAGFRLWAAAS
jgi:threonine dehydratase